MKGQLNTSKHLFTSLKTPPLHFVLHFLEELHMEEIQDIKWSSLYKKHTHYLLAACYQRSVC